MREMGRKFISGSLTSSSGSVVQKFGQCFSTYFDERQLEQDDDLVEKVMGSIESTLINTYRHTNR